MTETNGRDLSIGEALDLGCEHAMAGNHEQACGWFRGVLKHDPENFEATQRLGASLFEQKRYYEAYWWFTRGLKINRRHPLALTNFGLCLGQLGYPEEGLPDLERAVAIMEKSVGFSADVKALCYNNLGNSLERVARYADALTALDKGIACNPADPFPHYNRGIVLLRLNRHREAIAALEQSLELRGPAIDSPSRLNEADARYNLGCARLLLGDLKAGFEGYEYRLVTSENGGPNFGLNPARKWDGTQDIAGKRLLVHSEQGLGDTIQFLRFVPELVRRGANVQMICHAQDRVLCEQIPGVELPEVGTDFTFDLWVPLMSLPLCFGLASEADIPPPWAPKNEPGRNDRWGYELTRGQLESARAHTALRDVDALNVGICWAGNWQHKNDKHRSIALSTFAKLFEAASVNFVSLQQLRAEDTNSPLLNRPNVSCLWLDDWRDTAAVIRNLDLVITVDTAVAHMAASTGTPTWILIPKFSTDWRWQFERADSPWYPAARLYRQAKVGDWPSVIARMSGDLATLAASAAAA
jgi:Flp pilus assembly protein TadD